MLMSGTMAVISSNMQRITFEETAYYVDSIGFKDVSHLLPELHEVEAQRQKEQVQDEPER